MDHDHISTALPPRVKGDELEIIAARRKVAYPTRTWAQDSEDLSNDLRGLSISGGGIRSSTFSIGVIQSLAKADLFKDIDYVSTVSGGGYTGSMLSTLLNNDRETPDNFPLLMPIGGEEPKPLQHLRNGSNYLTPGGFLEVIRMPAVVVRGLIINFLILLPFIMAAVILTELAHESLPVVNIYQYIAELQANGFEIGLYGFWALLGLGIYFLLSGWYAIRKKWPRRNSYELWIARFFLLLIALVLFGPLKTIVDRAMQTPWYVLEEIIENWFHTATWVIGTSLVVIAVLVIKASAHLSAIAGKLVFAIPAIVGPAIIFAVYLLLVVAQVDSPFFSFTSPINAGVQPSSNTETNFSLSCSQVAAFQRKAIGIQGFDAQNEARCGASDSNPTAAINVAARYCGKDRWLLSKNPQASFIEIAAEGAPKAGSCADLGVKNLKKAGLLLLQPRRVWPSPELHRHEQREHGPITYEIRGADFFLYPDIFQLNTAKGATAWMDDKVFILISVFLFVLNYLFINVNQTSLHGFYRDRLSKLYLMDRDLAKGGEVRHNDDIKLSELNSAGTSVPYHIVNATLNLQGDIQESQRGRDADFFFFSKLYCGGSHTGYCDTKAMEEKDAGLNLGTAMAISAAAASPNMGSTTIRSLIFVLTLLNLRLGYWIPNPRFVASGKYVSKPWGRFLWREAIGKLTADTSLVNVSDGGHLENLALYEMLRRRCKTIICIDGEADPEHTFHGLVTLIRIARIDLGIEIDIDLNELRLNADGMCEKHFAVGKINYSDCTETGLGTLIYVKSSFIPTDQNNPFLRKYRADCPTFPHESTADQNFDERQFEAYRALGESVGRMLVQAIKDREIPWPEELLA